jgi:alkanesulfonate monooxygenase SsuD/methylene tetrahydromethanopterin reductase-like flavin-dependent oxidoreductase (luciferase family)
VTAVRFGLILPIQSQHHPLSELFTQLRAEVAEAEAAGFDAVLLTEFHQARGGALVSPFLIGAALLQGTERIRFGSAVLALPLHHPARLAEDVIMLDWITGGRVILGVGIGHQHPDFRLYGMDRARRVEQFEEAMRVLRAAFSDEPVDAPWDGRRLAGHVTPAACTAGGPPVWIGAHAEAGLRRAGRWADRWICDPQRDVATAGRLAARYREHAETAGRTPRVALFREAWVGDSRGECERVWAPHALAVHRLYYNVGVYLPELEPWVDDVRERADFTLDRIAPGRFLYGSPEEVRAEARAWCEETGADYLALRLRHPGGPSPEATLEAIRRFGAEVIAPLAEDARA